MKFVLWSIALGLLLTGAARAADPSSFVLGPPPVAPGPVLVQAGVTLLDLNRLSDDTETFEFTAILTLQWNDPRQAFDPTAAGVAEKVYQGAYQCNEVAPGWTPQVFLVNQADAFQVTACLLRVQPDGTSTLMQTINATAFCDLNLRRYPIDHHHLRAVFQILGFDRTRVAFVPPAVARPASYQPPRLPQWSIKGTSVSVEDRPADHAAPGGVASSLVMTTTVSREPFYVIRLVVVPLMFIVLLSFSVFWMDRSSLGDRINVSFIGILTGVAYQIVMSQNLPRISYVTLIHAFLSVSFLTMCATVIINLRVGALDKRKRFEAGDRIDRRCRWAFPVGYFGLLATFFTLVSLVFDAAD